MVKSTGFVRVLVASMLLSVGVMSGFARAESAPVKKIVWSERQPISSISVSLSNGALQKLSDAKEKFDFDELAAKVRERFEANSLLVASTVENRLTLEIRVTDFGKKFHLLYAYPYFIDAELILRDADGQEVGRSEASAYFSEPVGLVPALIVGDGRKHVYESFALEAMYVVTGKRPTKSILDM